MGPEYWAEPANAATNFSFIISGFLIIRMIRHRRHGEDFDIAPWLFALLICAIGIGSWLFHTHAQRWAMLADIIPIALFILIYTWYALRRFALAPVWVCTVGVIAVLAVAMAVPPLTGFRGGSYVAALMAMLVIGGYLYFVRAHPGGGALLLAAAVFLASLTLRTIDEPVCQSFPLGTHFLWHLLNATVLFIVARAMVLCGRRI